MVNLAQFPIRVDDVRLDTLAYAVLEHTLQVPGTRPGDLTIPGAGGVVASTWDDDEAGLYGLTIHVRAGDDDGQNASLERLYANLDEVVGLFRGRPDRLKRIRRQVRSSGTLDKVADVKVQDVIPITDDGLGTAEVRVSCLIPDTYWADPSTQDWSQAAAPVQGNVPVTILAGSTAPIHDAVFLVTGPIQNPTITDPTTGAWVRLNDSLAAGDTWRVNAATWNSTYRTAAAGALTLGSADTMGQQRIAQTESGGGSGRLLSLVPERTGRDARRVQVALSGTGHDATTSLAIRARRKFLT